MLVPLAVALTLLSTGERSRLELDASLGIDARPMSSTMPQAPAGRWIGGGATLGATLFLRSVADDDAAPSLQPSCSAPRACRSRSTAAARPSIGRSMR